MTCLLPSKVNLADLNLGAFLDHKGDADRGRRNRPNLGADGGELASVFGQQFLDRHFGFLDLGGIVLALWGQSDLRVLEAVEHVAVGNRT